ncbi:MAG TPA: M48 family metallopeptidase [Terriglobales bacterium]
MLPRRSRPLACLVVILGGLLAACSAGGGPPRASVQAPNGGASYYNPPWNMYSPQTDVEVGKQAAAQAEKQLPMLHNSSAAHYLTQLGDKLAQHMPGPQFPFNFHFVNQKEINAFALPGGPIFVNVGAVCAAANEAQLAGVVAHEESHVALRHSTSIASKQQLAQVPLAILGGVAGSGAAAQIANLGAQMVVGGVFLKYSRDMESQADALGAQVMNAAGYDPRQMVQFFETLEAQGGSQSLQFLSDHPNPGNRRAAIEEEISQLGAHPPYRDDSPQFEQLKSGLCGRH